MKKSMLILPLLFLGIKGNAQFNTASFKNDEIATIEVSQFSENHFSGTFLNYHIQGANNKKAIREARKREKEEQKLNSEKDGQEKKTDDVVFDILPKEKSENKEREIAYKRLEVIEMPEDNIMYEQLVYMPLNKIEITSNFGTRFHPIEKKIKAHNGVDLRASNDFVYSVLDGIIAESGYSAEAGNYIKIQHDSFETLYLHLDKFYHTAGTQIKAGDIIGISGNTGKSTAPHLHFAVKENGDYINPIHFLNDLIQTNNALLDYGKQ